MKRSSTNKNEESETVEKLRRTLSPNNNLKDVNDAVDSNTAAVVNTLKEINSETDNDANDLPSLNIGFMNNFSSSIDSSSSPSSDIVVTLLQKRIKELEEAKHILEADVSFYQKRHKNILKIHGASITKQLNPTTAIRIPKKQNHEGSKKVEESVEILKEQLLQSQKMVKTKDFLRIQIQHQLNDAQQKIINEKIAKEKAVEEMQKLKIELKNLQSSVTNKNNLINYIKNKFVNQESHTSETAADTVTLEELQKMISTKENTISSLQERLKEAYEFQESLKDEKCEAESEKEIAQNRCQELEKVVKSEKEKIEKLENQLEEIHEKFGQRQNDIEQENYEISHENESLKAKISGFHKVKKEKNEQIAKLQKDLDILQDLNKEINKKANAVAAELKEKLVQAEAENINLMEKYSNFKTEKDQKNAALDEKFAKIQSKVEAFKVKIDLLNAANSKIKAEKEKIEANLEISQKNEKQKVAEYVFEEMQKHEQTKKLLDTAISFNNTAYESSQQEAARATKAEEKFLQFKTLFDQEIAARQKFEDEVEKIKEKLDQS
uniref:Uncharacterized protein n=1 Tax=Panagrolaimus sp. ES5 TaxID=591445 RepID=A0AC34FXW6_9BILA